MNSVLRSMQMIADDIQSSRPTSVTLSLVIDLPISLYLWPSLGSTWPIEAIVGHETHPGYNFLRSQNEHLHLMIRRRSIQHQLLANPMKRFELNYHPCRRRYSTYVFKYSPIAACQSEPEKYKRFFR